MATPARPAARPHASPDAPSPASSPDMSDPVLYVTDRWHAPFAAIRAAGGIGRVADSPHGPHWNIASHAAIMHVESLPDLYSSSWEYGGITILDRDPAGDEFELPMFIAMDRPKHTGQRRTVAPAFTPAEMTRLAPDIRRRTAAILDGLPVGQPFDWVERVSIELTTGMLAILFDFPWEDRAKLTMWSDWMGDVTRAADPALRDERIAILTEAGEYFGRLWAARAAAPPAPDLLSMMIHSPAMADMPHQEFIGNLVLLIVGGNDTTRNSMSAVAYGFDRHPDEWARLSADPALVPNAVSEIIRWQTPLAHMRRTATADATIDGHAIARGDKLILWYLSANRDTAVFDDPDAICVDRPNARRHLAFGHGIHRCVGARLAELQLGILIEEMLERGMTVRLAGPEADSVDRVPACFVHGYRRLDVTVSRTD